jgi:uncharacterized protein YjdB
MVFRAGKVFVLVVAVVLSSLLVGCGGDAPPAGTAPTLVKLAISPSAISLPNGTTQQLAVTGTYSDGSSRNLTSLTSWTVTPSTSAKVSSTGLLTALAQGSATVNAAVTNVIAHIGLTVQAPNMTAIQITPSSVAIPLGAGQQLTATATYTDGTSSNVTNSVTWSTTPNTVASVSAAGMVQSVSKGSFSITATSGTINGSLNATVINAALQSLQVLPTSASIPKGTTQPFSATAIFTDGSKQDVTGSATWQSSNTGVATVSSTGTANSGSQGSSDISASYQSLSATSVLTVSAASIQSIQVSPSSASFAKGTNLQLSAHAVLTDGSTQDVTNSVAWSSSASSVCTVSASAMANAVSTGTCMATATSGSVSSSATLTVTTATLSGITLTPPNPSVASGGSVQLQAVGNFSDGSTQDMTSSVTYTSSKPLIAGVTSSGRVQGLTPGSATITAKSGSISASVSATVTTATLQSVTVGTGSLTVAAGVSGQLTAIGSYSDGSTQDLSATVTWSSSATTVAAVSATGNVTGIAAGSATITASLGPISGTASVTVTPATIVSITVNPLSVTIAAGQSSAFTATATLTDDTTTDVTASVHWSVSNPLLANISNSSGNAGLLTALIAGNATVSASLGSVTGTGNLYVSAATLVGISVGPTGLSLALGVPGQLTATGTFSDGSTQDITTAVTWSSSNGQCLTVSGAGLVTPLSIGSANVSASLSGQSGSVAVSITSAILNSIHISTSSSSLALGLSEQLTATGSYSDGSTQNITAVVHWSSNNTSTATVSAAGLVLAVGGGSANISATLGSVTQISPITVRAAILQSINVTAAQTSFALGFSLQLTATGSYSDGSTQDLTATASWTTSNPAIALVSSGGSVSGLSTGGITATATLQGVSGSLGVTVNAATLVSISISPATVSLAQLLLTQQFAVTGHFSDGSTQILSSGVHWSCSNGLLATINSTGLLTALGIGNLNVTATYGSLTASAAVSIL